MVVHRIILSTRFLCDVISVTLHDSHKITKIVTKFWILIKSTDSSHRCPADTNNIIDQYFFLTCFKTNESLFLLILSKNFYCSQLKPFSCHNSRFWEKVFFWETQNKKSVSVQLKKILQCQ